MSSVSPEAEERDIQSEYYPIVVFRKWRPAESLRRAVNLSMSCFTGLQGSKFKHRARCCDITLGVLLSNPSSISKTSYNEFRVPGVFHFAIPMMPSNR